MQFGVQFFPNFQPTRQERRRTISRKASPSPRRPTARLHACALGRALFRALRRLQPQPDRVSRRGGGSAPRRCGSSPARWCRCSTIRSSSPARSACSTPSRDGRFDVGFARAFLPHEFRRFRHFARRIGGALPRRARADRAVADAGECHPPRPVSFVRERHLAAASDAEAAAEILYRLDPDRRIRSSSPAATATR